MPDLDVISTRTLTPVHGLRAAEAEQDLDRFDLMPLGDMYDQLLRNAASSVTLRLAEYTPRRYDDIVGSEVARSFREPWVHHLEVGIDEAIHRTVSVNSPPGELLRARTRNILEITGNTTVGDRDVTVRAIGHKILFGWVDLTGLDLDQADMPALKAAAGDIPLVDDGFESAGGNRVAKKKYSHLYGDPADVVAALRKQIVAPSHGHNRAWQKYTTPEGVRAI